METDRKSADAPTDRPGPACGTPEDSYAYYECVYV